jgi:protein-disulfide isomerase
VLGVEPLLREKYVKNGQLLIVFAPVLNHADYSDQTHQAAECAAEQDRFWEFHDLLFERQDDFWAGDIQTLLKGLAAEANLELEQFNTCLDEQRYFELIRSQDEFRQEAGIRGQPVFYINGDYLVGSQPLEVFQATIENKLGE